MARSLFSIHGINTKGEWQDGIRDIMSQFFEYVALRYRPYETLPRAIWRLAGDVIFALATVSVWTFAVIRHKGSFLYPAAAGYLVIATISFLIHRANALCLKKVVDSVYSQIQAPSASFSRPSVIAHSLGTLLTARAMRVDDLMAVDTIIFHGCVVNRHFDWDAIRSRYKNVYNEIGRRDPVPAVANLLRFTVSQIGNAGAKGFQGNAVYKEMQNPNKIGCLPHGADGCCSNHAISSAPVSNVLYESVGHSYLDGVRHALKFWLPRLLHYDPVLYGSFYEECKELDTLRHQEGYSLDFERKLNAFLDCCYGWGSGSLRATMRVQINSVSGPSNELENIDDVVKLAAIALIQKISETLDCLPRPTDGSLQLPLDDDPRWKLLDPKIAVTRGVASALNRLA